MEIHQQELYDKIFGQIPCLRYDSLCAPYIGKNYGSDAGCRILIVLCSVYDAHETTAKEQSISEFYKARPEKGNEHFYPECSKEDFLTLYADFISVRRIRQKIEQAVTAVSPDKTLEDIAHCHFILRPLRGPADKPSATDLNYAIEAFPKIIDILKPTHILFFGNDCLRTVSRRAFTKSVENKSIETFLSDKGIAFSTISRRADYQAKTSVDQNQKLINDLLNQLEEQANGIKESLRQVEMLRKEIDKIAESEMPKGSTLDSTAVVGGAIGAAAGAVSSALGGSALASLGLRAAAPIAAPVFGAVAGPIVAGAVAGASILTLVNKLRTLVGNDDSDENAGMGKKSDFIMSLALENQKKFATITFGEFAEKLNQAGFLTARGEKFSAEGNGPLLLVNKVFKKCAANQSDYDTAVAIAMTFVNDRTGLPWILNEAIENLIKKGTLSFEDGILKSPVTDEPITEKDISPKLIKNASIKDIDDKLKDMLVEYLERKQKHIREIQG